MKPSLGIRKAFLYTMHISIAPKHQIKLPYSKYYKSMGDLPYISSEQGWDCNTSWGYNAYISVLYLYKNFELKRGVGLLYIMGL